MLLDYEVAHCSRRCAASGRPLTAGEVFISALRLDNGAPVRLDYAPDAWPGDGEGVVAWWRARVPEGDGVKPKLAPTDVLLNLFAELATQPGEAEFRYVLGLLLVRRKLVRIDQTRRDAEGELLVLDCPRREEQFELRVAAPAAEKTAELERRMVELLYGGE